MSEQDQTQHLPLTMQEMMAQMARMQIELDNLKLRTQTLPQFEEREVKPAQPPAKTGTRRKTLKRLGLAVQPLRLSWEIFQFRPGSLPTPPSID